MQTISATKVSIGVSDLYPDCGVTFTWDDELYGFESLRIELSGWCGRRMPIYSGNGSVTVNFMDRTRINLHFATELAGTLRLDEELEITFAELSEDDFEEMGLFAMHLCKARQR